MIKCPGKYVVGDREVELDEDCFLADPSTWSEDVAIWIAENVEGLTLTEEHWRLIRYVRSYWEAHGECPHIKRLLRDLGITFEDLYRLFPSGPADGLCKIAGTSRPLSC